mgnify:CR=1 FL=1
MNILLAALSFRNGDLIYNKNKIVSTIKEYSNKVDLILFGESFLQGFDALTWNFEIDKNIALSKDSKLIKEIKKLCKKFNVSVSFGYFELFDSKIFSSQIVINKQGKIIFNYRRVSSGWRIKETDNHYQEGTSFSTFELDNKIFALALCGDLWNEENVNIVLNLPSDYLLWPVYTDFNYNEWNNVEKNEYAMQAKKFNKLTLYVNSYCLDSDDNEIAKGGAAVFKDGMIINEIPSGKEDVLIIKI